MAQKMVAKNPTPAKSQGKTEASASTTRLQVVLSEQAPMPGPWLASTLDVYELIGRELSLADRENFIVLHLNCKNQLLAKEVISAGSLNSTIVTPREVFRGAVLNGSAAIVCAHNHPSGDPTPSSQDMELTARLQQAAELVGIRLHDHLIIGRGTGARYYSFANSGALSTGAPVVLQGLTPQVKGSDFKAREDNSELSRESAKRKIDEAANRLAFLVDGLFSDRLEDQRPLFAGTEGICDGLNFVLLETRYVLEDLYYNLYPETLPEWRSKPNGWSGNPPSWDNPDMSCCLMAPINGLNLLCDSFLGKVGAHERISDDGFAGMGAIVRDIRSSLQALSADIEKAMMEEVITTMQ